MAERIEKPTERHPLRAGLGGLVRILCIAFAAFVIAEDVGLFLWDAGLATQAGALGASFDLSSGGSGSVRVQSVEPGGAMSGLVVVGDRVAFDRHYDDQRFLKAGEVVDFTVLHKGAASRRRIVVAPRNPVRMTGPVEVLLIFDLAWIVSALLGAFIVWRGGRRATPLLLGMALVCEGLSWIDAPFWLSEPNVYPFGLAVGMFAGAWAIPVLFYAFALRFYEDCAGPTKAWEKTAFWLYALVQAALTGLLSAASAMAIEWPLIGNGTAATFYVGSTVGLAVCLAYLFLGWRRSSAGVQQRYALILFAASLSVLAQVAGNFLTHGAPQTAYETALFLIAMMLGAVIAPALFAHAILHHKVFDLGFAVNRTLVYAVVSVILLAAFGLIEWAIDHLVPIQGREKNALVDAAIAVGVFLTFHRVRGAVEKAVEGLFFRRWQKAEAALRRFVREAAFFEEAPGLTQGFVHALSEYAEGAPAGLYLPEERGFTRVAGDLMGVPDWLPADLRALVSLRAEPRAVEVRDDDLNAALLAPMVNRNEVIGLAVLGPKPSGLNFRPDEVELIGWATQQVGLDLHALKMEQLEATAARQREELARSETRIDELRLALGGRASV